MGQILHASATTTEATRRAIQHSQESLRAQAQRYGISEQTVYRWKNRQSVYGRPHTAHQLPQSALKGQTPMQAMKLWHRERPDLFNKRPYDRAGCET